MTLKEHNGFTLIELVLAVFMLTITMAHPQNLVLEPVVEQVP